MPGKGIDVPARASTPHSERAKGMAVGGPLSPSKNGGHGGHNHAQQTADIIVSIGQASEEELLRWVTPFSFALAGRILPFVRRHVVLENPSSRVARSVYMCI